MYEFSLKTLWTTILGKKKRILVNLILAFIVGVIIAFSIPKIYVSKVELVAELQSSNNLSGAASLASLAGIKMGNEGETIVPDLYPNIMSSNKFLVSLLNVPVETKNGDFKGTYLNYLETQTRIPWWSYPMSWIKGLFSSTGESADSGEQTINPEHLSVKFYNVVSGLKGNVKCDISSSDGLINIIARAQDPLVAKTLVDSATITLQKFITDYRTNKARIDLKYYQTLEKEALENYKQAQRAYAEYCDSHKGLISKVYIMEQNALDNDVQLCFNAYSQMAQQVQMAMAKVQENTPAFTTINAASVAPLADSPKKKIIVFAIVFLTLVGNIGWIYFSLLFKNVTSPKVQTEKSTDEKSETVRSGIE